MPPLPKLTVEWSINLGSILTLATIIIGGFTTFYKLAEQVSVNTNNIISIQEDRKYKWDQVTKRLAEQDDAREKLAIELKQALRDQHDDIKSEFRDLRSDLRKQGR